MEKRRIGEAEKKEISPRRRSPRFTVSPFRRFILQNWELTYEAGLSSSPAQF